MEKVYDAIVVGGGPAGLTSAIYLGRAKKNVLIIEKFVVGGAVNLTYEIKNFPGFLDISGVELIEKMKEQVSQFNVDYAYDEVTEYDFSSKIKKIGCKNGTFFGKTVILCNGASAKKLGLEQEEQLTGSGVSYCAICDGAFFKNANVAVVGGGNTAVEDALYLSNIASKVFVVCRRDSLTADKVLVDNLTKKENVKILYSSNVTKLNGATKLESVVVQNSLTNSEDLLDFSGLFVAIGRAPSTNGLSNLLDLTENGYIKTNENMETSVKGVYASGDVRDKSVRQIITACSDGAIAGTKVNQFLEEE